MKITTLVFFAFLTWTSYLYAETNTEFVKVKYLPLNLLNPDWEELKQKKASHVSNSVSHLKNIQMFKDKPLIWPKYFLYRIPSMGLGLRIENKSRENPQEAENLQKFIDTAILNIMRTPTGNLLTYRLTANQPEFIQSLLGINHQLSYELTAEFQKNIDPSYEVAFQKARENKNASSAHITGGVQRFHFIYTFDESGALDSWTDNVDDTTIFIRPQDLKKSCESCSEKFYRVFAHELAQSADANSFLRMTAFQKIYKGNLFCKTLSAITHPQIRMALSTARAYQVEDQILSELGFTKKNHNYTKIKSCKNILKPFINFSKKYVKTLKVEKEYQRMQLSSVNCPTETAHYDFDELLNQIDQSKAITENEKEIPLCDYLLKINFDSPVFRPQLSRGPRCRVGNGCGD